MSLVNRTACDLIPSTEMKTFMDELSRVTDRETFNSLMKRFDESFMQRYQTSNKQEKGKFPFGSTQEVVMPKTAPPISQPYSNMGSFYQGEPPRFQQDPRSARYPQEPNYSSYPVNFQNEPLQYPAKYIEDSYNVPMYNRAFPPEQKDRQQGYPRNDTYGRPQVYGRNELYDIPQAYPRNEFIDKSQGYMRTEYVPYNPYPPGYNSNPGNNPYQPSPAYNTAPGNNPNPRNPFQESIDLRKVKEDMLQQSKVFEQKPLENINLPPPRYETPLYENPQSYQPSTYKPFYPRN